MISVTNSLICGLRNDGIAWCWGKGWSGGLGNGLLRDSVVPELVSTEYLPRGKWVSMSFRNDHACGIRNDATTWCWGYGFDGERGDGSNAEIETLPSKVVQ